MKKLGRKIKNFFSNLWDWVIVLLSALAGIIFILACILIPFVLSVGGICFIIWFFFECLGAVI